MPNQMVNTEPKPEDRVPEKKEEIKEPPKNDEPKPESNDFKNSLAAMLARAGGANPNIRRMTTVAPTIEEKQKIKIDIF